MTIDATLLTTLLLLPFVGSALASFLPTKARNAAALLAGAVTVAGLLITVLLYRGVAPEGVVRHVIPWLPSLGLDIVLRVDGLSWIFSLLITGIGALVVLYARYYMSPDDPVPRFFTLLLAFMGSMLGVVLSGNLIQLVFFWELTSLFSFLLIGYWHHNANARDGAKMALIVTSAGGFCLLLGAIVLGNIAGSFDIDVVLAAGRSIQDSPLFTPALLLILVGALSKSAQFPFHFWLPHAMAAPTPVSAYLHSATMVKAGIYLMARLWPVAAGNDTWFYTVATAGLITFLVGGFIAIFQNDLKGILAYSTISHLGLITLLLGLGTPTAMVAAIFHILNHAAFKASLFMAAGIVDHETGTRDVRRLSGLMRAMPVTGALAALAAAAMAGVPLLNGFLSKEMFLVESLGTHTGSVVDLLLPVLATLGSAFGVIYSLRLIHQVFLGPPATDLPKAPHEPVAWMRRPVELLVLICVLVGIYPPLIAPVLGPAVASVLGDAVPYYSLAIWHGFNTPLVLSLGALAGGALIYFAAQRALRGSLMTEPPWAGRLKVRRLFEQVMHGLVDGAAAIMGRLWTRRLQPQLVLLLLAALLVGSTPFVVDRLFEGGPGLSFGPSGRTDVDPVFVVIWLIAAACAIGTALLAKYHRVAALILLGGTGLISCLTFVWLSAPDLAVTQLLVEIVTTVLLLIGLRWLPKRFPADDYLVSLRARARRVRDFVISVAAGGGIALLAFAAMTRPLPHGISDFFLQNSYEGAGGRNVVNVLLVDFRGFDTMGEITVLGIVALTVFALLRRFRPAKEMVETPQQQRRQDAYDEATADRQVGDTAVDYLYVPRVVMHLMFPIIAVFAAYLFLRGHDAPGGGFAAGVAMSIAFILQYMASGTRWVEERLRVLPLRWIGLGLLLAAGTGLGATFFGVPFLTSYYEYLELPVLGRIPISSATVFDLGVFVLVVGATVLMIIALAHQSIRSPRAVAPAPPGDDDGDGAGAGGGAAGAAAPAEGAGGD